MQTVAPRPDTFNTCVLAAAQHLHALGWDLVPVCAPAPGGGCSAPWHRACTSPGKVPVLPFADRSPAWLEVERVLRERDCGIAVLTGRQVVAVEADDVEADALLGEMVGTVPTPCRAARPGRGRAFLFAAPDVPLGNRAHVGGHALDVRGARGVLILPPSPHSSGWVHRWEVGCEPWTVPLAPLPPRLLELVTTGATAPATGSVEVMVGELRPPGRLGFLLAAHRRLRDLWDGRPGDWTGRRLARDASRSGIDFAFARELLRHGLKPGEVAAAIAARPGAHSTDPTYCARTVEAAMRRGGRR